jgi:hypothetical protein
LYSKRLTWKFSVTDIAKGDGIRRHRGFKDEVVDKTFITFHLERDTVGTWQRKKPRTFGLVCNGDEIPLPQVVRLQKISHPKRLILTKPWGRGARRQKIVHLRYLQLRRLGQERSFQNVHNSTD